MKKLIFTTILTLTVCIFGHAQLKFPELDKTREIKLLQSNRKDVKRILKGFKHNKSEDKNYIQTFSNENAEIKITFSKGEGCGDEDSENIWNISEWKVVWIEIYPKIPLRFEDIRIQFSNFQKEQLYVNVKDIFVYSNKDLGIAFKVDEKDVVEKDEEGVYENSEVNVVEEEDVEEDNIETIFLFAPNGSQSLLCNNEKAEEYENFYTNESFFTEPNLEKRYLNPTGNPAPIIYKLELSTTEIIIGCTNSAENESCSDNSREIKVKTSVNYGDNDILSYIYEVSGGKILGKGAEVVWDLTDVEPGTYTITVGVNDGCGICQPTKTETVVIKECNDCLPK